VFFLVPLATDRDGELLATTRLRADPGLHAAELPRHLFEGCGNLDELCVTFKTYLSTLKFCLLVWAADAG
jgi:putative spermidine/putrescine transport system permease protein